MAAVSEDLLRQLIAVQFHQVGQCLSLISALVDIIRSQNLMTPEMWQAAVEKANMSEDFVRNREIAEKVLGRVPLESVIQEFAGTIR